MKLNRNVVKQLLERGEPLQHAANRCVGKTTKAIFYAIALSYENFGSPILVDDPDVHLIKDGTWLLNRVREVLSRNNLTAIKATSRSNGNVVIINTFAENIN
jgi:hypothetical protein